MKVSRKLSSVHDFEDLRMINKHLEMLNFDTIKDFMKIK